MKLRVVCFLQEGLEEQEGLSIGCDFFGRKKAQETQK